MGTADTPSDGDLAQRAAAGDTLAFERIMRRHNRLLFRTARSILRTDAESEDALQEAYLRAWGGIGGFRADARLSTWLVRIVINESLARLRRRGASEPDGDAPVDELLQANPDDAPDSAAMRAEGRRLLEAHIGALPDDIRTVFMLRAVEELSSEEVAAALGVTEETVRTRFSRARSALREALGRDIDPAAGDLFLFDGARCDRVVTFWRVAASNDKA